MKKNRHEALLRIVESKSVSTQTELLELLNAEGYNTTQATISRDIKDLRLIKKTDEMGRTFYCVDTNDNSLLSDKYKSVFNHSVISADYALNTVVIKCYTGMAQGVCAALDSMNISSIVGTIAGDDTIFAACQTQDDAMKTADDLSQLLK